MLDALQTLEMVATLTKGKSVTIGQVSLFPDREMGLVWGTDPYGIDFVAAQGLDDAALRKALQTAVTVDQAKDHPAERRY